MAIIRPVEQREGINSPDFIFWCPGCQFGHGVWTTHKNPSGAQWSFDGNMQAPTFEPSILVEPNSDKRRCHSVVQKGIIKFGSDCHHSLAGKEVPLPDW